jgi:hypothetical protein
MVETTLDIRFSADDDPHVAVRSNVAGDLQEQSELLCSAHYAARMIALLGSERAAALIEWLAAFDGGPEDRPARAEGRIHAAAGFLDTRAAPRISFRVKLRGVRPESDEGARLARDSAHAVFVAMLARRGNGTAAARRLVDVAHLLGQLGASGEITPGSEVEAALAVADVAWRRESPGETAGREILNVECPSCGATGSFEPRLWPSRRAMLGCCTRCGSGIWLRQGHSPRSIASEIWRATEALRGGLRWDDAAGPDDASNLEDDAGGRLEADTLLGQLKGVFAANGWPFSEVRGLPVLVSELSGPLGSWQFYAQVAEEHESILLYSVCPLRVPENRRPEIASFLTRANYGLAAGNFELDFDDGEIRCKTVVHVDGELRSEAVKKLVRANGVAMETYLPGIGAVITGTPGVRALARTES